VGGGGQLQDQVSSGPQVLDKAELVVGERELRDEAVLVSIKTLVTVGLPAASEVSADPVRPRS
jgi:hypothetical protein